MARDKITLTDWKKDNPNGTLEDWEKAVGRKALALEKAAIGAKKQAEKSMAASVTNDKGESSLAANPTVNKIVSKINTAKIEPVTEEGKKKIKELETKAAETLKAMDGKSEKEQDIVFRNVFEPKKEEPKKEKTYQPETTVKTELKEETASDDNAPKTTEERRSAFLESWAATHPTWGQILKDENLSFGQKASLIGSALANMGANVTLGAKSGFEHSGFNPVEWDFKKAVDKYSNQDIENVLKAEQDQRAKEIAGDFWRDYEKKYGKKATEELIALGDMYGDNPEILRSRFAAMGFNKSADEIKDLYASREKTNLSEDAKQKIYETEAKRLANDFAIVQKYLAENNLKLSDATLKSKIDAENAVNDFSTTKYNSDKSTYNLEKVAGYIRNVVHEVEAAGGNIVGIRDGIVKAKGIPQKLVRADGSEVILSPDDNIYATEKPMTTDKDNGGEVVPMDIKDEVYFQKKLGYSGGEIRKDFDYYLKRLGA